MSTLKKVLTLGIIAFLIFLPTFIINISPKFRQNSQLLTGPDFSEKQVPPVWYGIYDWLVTHGALENEFRTLVIPLPVWAPYFTLSTLNAYVPNYFQVVGDYTDFMNYLIEGRGNYFGEVLAPAAVKYILVPIAAVRVSAVIGSNSDIYKPFVEGAPRLWYGYANIWWPIGNPDAYVALLNNQRDLSLVYEGSDFLVYENLNPVENIAVYKKMYLVYENAVRFLEFDANGYIKVPDSPSFNITDAITIEAWFKPLGNQQDSVVTKGYQYLVFGGTYGQNPRIQFGLAFTDGTNSWDNLLIGNTSMYNQWPYTWYHIVGELVRTAKA